MKLDPDLIHYLTKEHFRVLTAVEMGMKNHEFVPVPLIESLAALKRSNTYKVIQFLLKHKLVMHVNKQYDGYALTYGGYDYLALKAFMKRGHIKQVSIKIGVGKESDIYLAEQPDGEIVVIKFARLGRTSFRTVKANRDYLKGGSNHSWLYLSRIASLKEHAFMKALYNKGFPTPVPIDSNRHAIVMSYIRSYPMSQVKELQHPQKVYEDLIEQIIRLAEHGLVHGDFNEFNLLISEDEKITIIDFPQMTSTNHPNATFYFERDIKCIQEFFQKRFGLIFEGMPRLDLDVEKKEDLDKEIRASGFVKEQLGEDTTAFDNIVWLLNFNGIQHEHFLDKERKDQEEESDEEVDEESDDNDEGEEGEQDGDQKEEQLLSEENELKQDNGGDAQNENKRKVKFQDEQQDSKEDSSSDDEVGKKEEDNPDQENKEEDKKREKPEKKKKEKLVVNEDYVKERVKKQFWNNEKKKNAKRNKNKDKKVMKANECIKDYYVE